MSKSFWFKIVAFIIILAIVAFLGSYNVEGFDGYSTDRSLLAQARKAIDDAMSSVTNAVVEKNVSSMPSYTSEGFTMLDESESTNTISNALFTLPVSEKPQDCGSSGLTRSGGFICLDSKTKQLLTTRGGNFS